MNINHRISSWKTFRARRKSFLQRNFGILYWKLRKEKRKWILVVISFLEVLHGGSSADLISLKRDSNASYRPPAATCAERSVKEGKKCFPNKFQSKTSNFLQSTTLYNFAKYCVIWNHGKYWRFFVNKQSRWSFSRKANLFVDLMKSNLIKKGERKSEADIGCKNAGEKSERKFFFMVCFSC